MPSFEFPGSITLSSIVSDLDTSITWFKDKLGFEDILRAPQAGWAEFTSPRAMSPSVSRKLMISAVVETRSPSLGSRTWKKPGRIWKPMGLSLMAKHR